MTKWLRWQGLVVFGAVFMLLFLVWFFLADMIVKRSIEKAGTRVVGAKVELAGADVHIFPLGITLKSLQVTNPDSPMSNALEAGRIEFSLDSLNLLRRKIIIDTMAMEGVRFNTPRNTSGAVTLQDKDKEPPAKIEETPSAAPYFPSFQIPDIHEVLAREKLETLEQIKHLRVEIDTVKADWGKRLADAPDQKTFEQYQARANKLQQGSKGISGVLTITNDLKKLQKDVSKDLNQLKDIQKNFTRDTDTLKKKLDQLKSAPQQDIHRILNTYALSADGLGNVSQLLFGDKIGGTVQKALFWYGKIKPLLTKTGPGDKKDRVEKPGRGKGVYVRFKETEPLPDLLARQVSVSMIIPAGDMQGELRHVTTDQPTLGIPLEFNFSGAKLKGVQSIDVTGAFDHIDPNNSRDQVIMAIQKYRVKDFTLSASDNLPITLKNGLAHLNLTAALHEDMLDADVQVTMDAAELETGKKAGGNHLQQALHAALADVSTFSVKAKVTGPPDNYRIQMTSDLDKVLKNAVGRQVKNLTTEFQDKLRASILDKVKGPMADTSNSMSGLDSITQEISSRMDLGNDVSNNLLKGLGGKSKIKF
jgi:uncharacterized protein (TIGR03545 family)